MKKIYLLSTFVALVVSIVFAMPVGVFAQYYYTPATTPTQYNYNTSYASYVPTYGAYNTYGACTNLSSNLYQGLRDTTTGGQVSALQSFLISQRYLTIATPTGQFGPLTYQAVARYQYEHGLQFSGVADVATRASIQSATCGNNYGYNYGNNYNYNYGNNYGYNNYYTVPALTSLSMTSGAVGSSVTIYGSGFDYSNKTVNFNGVAISGLSSYNGTSLTFTVPQVYNTNYNYNYNYNYNNSYNTGTYLVTVTTSRGTSNSLSFTVTSGNTNCYNGGYTGVYYGYTGGMNNNCYGQPYLSSISPNSARVGTQVVINGSNFSSYGNTVHFGNGGKTNVSSNNGTTIYYTIPSYITPCDVATSGTYCAMYAQQVTAGTYPVYVSNSNGQTSTMYFTVTQY